MTALLRVDGLSVEFRLDGRWVRVVDNVSFDIHAGERVAIVGESGSGKSVTALATLGLLDKAGRVAGGSAHLGELELTSASRQTMEDVRGGRIAMVFQDALSALDPVFTIGQQIEGVLRRHVPELARNDRAKRSLELLASVGIADPRRQLNAYPHQLSGGMRQRALIATALAGDPEILIADEPTTALDVTVQAQVVELLVQLSRERSMALVLITHDLGVVGDAAERALVMYCGRIVEDAPVQQLFVSAEHPYSGALLASVPSMLGPRPSRLDAIPGVPPRAGHAPSGCAFGPRCARRGAECDAVPPLADTPTGRVACHHPLVRQEGSP